MPVALKSVPLIPATYVATWFDPIRIVSESPARPAFPMTMFLLPVV
jgi:hypothetical protein